MQVHHYEFIFIKEIDKLLENSKEINRKDVEHLREKLLELIKQNDRFAMLYHLSAKEIYENTDEMK